MICLFPSFVTAGERGEEDLTDVVILAKDFAKASPEVNPEEIRWSKLTVLNARSGFMEWNFCIPEPGGLYYFHILYATAQSRPVSFSLDGEVKSPPGGILGNITGSFFRDGLRWEVVGPFELLPGDHHFRLDSQSHMPHFRGFLISGSGQEVTPENNPFAEIDRQIEREEAALRQQQNQFRKDQLKTWSMGTDCNTEEFGRKIDSLPVDAPDFDVQISLLKKEFARKILLNNDVHEILFIKRKTNQGSHYYTDYIDGIHYFGTDLVVLNVETGEERSLIPNMTEGVIHRCDLSYDAKKVVFDYKRKYGEGFRLWEVGLDGSGLRQITFPPDDEPERIRRYAHRYGNTNTDVSTLMYSHHTDDMQPCWLPDGTIAFVSTRCEKGILCDGGDRFTTTVLYRVKEDGTELEQLSQNALSEATPSVTDDGRILYTRWEYVDKGSITNKGLWTVRPDGTGAEEVYGANIAWPPVHYAGRCLSGSNHLFVCVGTPHMPLAVGSVILVDNRKNRRTGEPMTYITPEVETRHLKGWDNYPNEASKPIQPPLKSGSSFHDDTQWDGHGKTFKGPLYGDPYPLSEELFLVTFNQDKEWNDIAAYQLALINRSGLRLPFHQADGTSCWCPIPVHKREVPPPVHGVIDSDLAAKGLAQVTVSDIYQGLDGVEQGTIKYIRVNEHVARPWSARRWWNDALAWNEIHDQFDQQHSVITRYAHLGLKVQHGIVPVESDGSANFYVKADRNIFFQALDADYKEVQRERTFTNYRPGEVRSCIGCHETASDTLAAKPRHYPIALAKPPVMPGPQPGETTGQRPLHFPSDVQPVLDRYCVSCHGNQEPAANITLTGDLTRHFSRSYEELMNWNSFPVIGENNPKSGNVHYLPPYSLGSHASRLIKRIEDPNSPCHVNMTLEDRIRLTTWVDSNGQYYGSYFGKKDIRYQEDPEFRPEPTFEETQTSIPPGGLW